VESVDPKIPILLIDMVDATRKKSQTDMPAPSLLNLLTLSEEPSFTLFTTESVP
jgi:hypothetical protein